MDTTRSAFLTGALAWIGNGTIHDRCDVCAFEWTVQSEAAVEAIEAAPDRYASLLANRDGMVAADDGGWNATAYLWHLTDLARSWSERWVQLANDPGSLLAGWDPDELAAGSSTTPRCSSTATGAQAPSRTVCGGSLTSTRTTNSTSTPERADDLGPPLSRRRDRRAGTTPSWNRRGRWSPTCSPVDRPVSDRTLRRCVAAGG
jgi:hypothetical protein